MIVFDVVVFPWAFCFFFYHWVDLWLIPHFLLKCLFSVLRYTIENSFKKHQCHSCYKILMQLYTLYKGRASPPPKQLLYPPTLPLYFLKLKLFNLWFMIFLNLGSFNADIILGRDSWSFWLTFKLWGFRKV